MSTLLIVTCFWIIGASVAINERKYVANLGKRPRGWETNFFVFYLMPNKTRIIPPLLRQFPEGRGGEDGLAEAFEDGGDAVEAFAAGVYPREDRVELVGDALLFVEGWHSDSRRA